MSEPRTTCRDCGEELWGADEAGGQCAQCHREEERLNDDQGDDYEDWDHYLEGDHDDQADD